MGYLAKKGFKEVFAGGKLSSKLGPPIKKWKFQTYTCGVFIQSQWSGMLALCTQISIWRCTCSISIHKMAAKNNSSFFFFFNFFAYILDTPYRTWRRSGKSKRLSCYTLMNIWHGHTTGRVGKSNFLSTLTYWGNIFCRKNASITRIWKRNRTA